MRFIFIIIFLFSFSTYGQKPTIDQVLDSIYFKANQRGLDLKPLYEKYVGEIIVVDTLPRSKYNTEVIGMAKFNRVTRKTDLYVINDMFGDFFNLERIITHEMGHAFGLKHIDFDEYSVRIMTPQQTTDPYHILYEIAYKTTEYEVSYDIFFSKIRERLCDGDITY